MGLLHAIKDLFGGISGTDLAEQVGFGNHLGAMAKAVQQFVEELGAVAEVVGPVVDPIGDGWSSGLSRSSYRTAWL